MAQDPTNAQGGEFAESKGKGKAVASEQDLKGDTAMDEDDDDDEDEDAAEVGHALLVTALRRMLPLVEY